MLQEAVEVIDELFRRLEFAELRRTAEQGSEGVTLPVPGDPIFSRHHVAARPAGMQPVLKVAIPAHQFYTG